jgi:hypothetical protein
MKCSPEAMSKQHPTKIMELEWRKAVGLGRYCFFDRVTVFSDDRFTTRLHLRDDGESDDRPGTSGR